MRIKIAQPGTALQTFLCYFSINHFNLQTDRCSDTLVRMSRRWALTLMMKKVEKDSKKWMKKVLGLGEMHARLHV